MRKNGRLSVAAVAMLGTMGLSACGAPVAEEDLVKEDEPGIVADGKADSSVEGSFLIFEFDGEIEYTFGTAQSLIEDTQLLYTIGHLNGNNSSGRLDNLTLSNIKTTTLPDGKKKATYHAVLPVAWGSRTNLPKTYELTLPKKVQELSAFTSKYNPSCVERGAHDVDEGSMWYYFRPAEAGCNLDPTDVIRTTATITPSNNVTTGKYPEYNKVWEDNTLRVVSIFGKYKKTGTTAADAGISAYNEFVSKVRTLGAMTTVPAVVPSSPGIGVPDIEFTMSLPGGKKLIINALLVDEIASAPQSFRTRYDQLSTRADLIAYNGHAGLGQNIRALAQWGTWTAGQYLILYSNGCDTYAYVDGSLATERSSINLDDPKGTKYLDFIVNAMPSYFHASADSTLALVKGLLKFDAPQTYETMFRSIDDAQVVLVTGEEDNVYTPGGPGPITWAGIDESGTLAKGAEKRYEAASLAAGKYSFEITGTGDADLYVKIGSKPSTSSYDCRPYKNGSAEKCTVTLNETKSVNVMVRGYAATSNFRLVGKKQ